METIKVNLINSSLEERKKTYDLATKILKNGGLVIFPTETVYGLGALATDEVAVEKIFKAKGRPQDNPLIVHIGDDNILENLNKYVKEIPDGSKALIKKFWPGPLTIIFKKNDILPDVTTANLSTVGIRVPSNLIAKELLNYSKLPIAAPSANISGRPSPTTFKRCIEDMDGRVDLIIGYDNSEIGLESTIIDVTVTPNEVLRPGGITLEDLNKISKDVYFKGNIRLKDGEKPRAPGMKYRHYSPKASVSMIRITNKDYGKLIETVTKDSLLIYFGEIKELENFIAFNKENILGKVVHFKDEIEGSKEIFEVLRQADDDHISSIYIVETKESGIGLALMNRLTKASGFTTIEI